MHRSEADGAPGPGFYYTGEMIGPMLTLASSFARIGDYELFNYSTSLGTPDDDGTPPIYVPNGGPKTLLSISTLYAGYVNGSVLRYTYGHGGDSNWIIDSIDNTTGQSFNRDHNLAIGNLYFRDTFLKSIYMRTASGAPAYPASPSSFGAYVWGD